MSKVNKAALVLSAFMVLKPTEFAQTMYKIYNFNFLNHLHKEMIYIPFFEQTVLIFHMYEKYRLLY